MAETETGITPSSMLMLLLLMMMMMMMMMMILSFCHFVVVDHGVPFVDFMGFLMTRVRVNSDKVRFTHSLALQYAQERFF